MKRRQPTTTDYFVTIKRGQSEISLGPYQHKEQAIASGRRCARQGDRVQIEKNKFVYLSGVPELRSSEIEEVSLCQ